MLTGKHRGKRPLGRPSHMWEHNIRMDLKEMGINEMDWLDSVQDRDYWIAFVHTGLDL